MQRGSLSKSVEGFPSVEEPREITIDMIKPELAA
jgi:hypothetical protein